MRRCLAPTFAESQTSLRGELSKARVRIRSGLSLDAICATAPLRHCASEGIAENARPCRPRFEHRNQIVDRQGMVTVRAPRAEVFRFYSMRLELARRVVGEHMKTYAHEQWEHQDTVFLRTRYPGHKNHAGSPGTPASMSARGPLCASSRDAVTPSGRTLQSRSGIAASRATISPRLSRGTPTICWRDDPRRQFVIGLPGTNDSTNSSE
jgi:hypothetical protein